MLAVDTHQRQQRRGEIDLADEGIDPAWSHVGAEDHSRDVELADWHELIAIHARVVIGDHEEQRVRPLLAVAGALDELAESVIGILHGVVHGLLLRVVQLDAPVRKLERRVIGGREHQHEERPAGRVQRADARLRHLEQVFVRYAPAADELRRREVLAVDDTVEAVAEEEAAHVVEVRFAAVDEFAAIAGTLQHRGQRGEVVLRLRQLHDTERRRRRKARDDRFDAAHRASPGRVQLIEPDALPGEAVQIRRDRYSAELLHEARAEALLQHDDQIERLRALRGRNLPAQRGPLFGCEVGGRHTHSGSHSLDHFSHRHIAVHPARLRFVLQAVRGRQHRIGRVGDQAVDHRIVAECKRREIGRPVLETRAHHDEQDDHYDWPHQQHCARAPYIRVPSVLREVAGKDPSQSGNGCAREQQQAAIAVPQHRQHFARIDQVFEEEAVRPAVVLDQELRCRQLEEDDQDQAQRQPAATQRDPPAEPSDQEQRRQQHQDGRGEQPERHEVAAQPLHEHRQHGIRGADALPLPRHEQPPRHAESEHAQQEETQHAGIGAEATNLPSSRSSSQCQSSPRGSQSCQSDLVIRIASNYSTGCAEQKPESEARLPAWLHETP